MTQQREKTPRTRTKDETQLCANVVWTHYPLSCANRIWHTYQTDTAYFRVGSKATMHDFVEPQFARKVSKGEMIFQPMWQVKTDTHLYGYASIDLTTVANACLTPSTPGRYKAEGNFTGYYANGIATTSILSNVAKDRCVNDAVTKCLAKRGQGIANFIESFAELDQVWHLLRNPLENLHDFLRNFRRSANRRYVKGRRVKPSVQGTLDDLNAFYTFGRTEWLRFRYGISPVMQDVAAAMKTISKGHPPRAVRVASRSSGSIGGSSVTPSSYNYGGIFSINYQDIFNEDYLVRCVWYDQWKPDVFSDLGINVTNVLAVGWELTRLSFVLDWVVNVGDWIYANIPKVGIDSVGGSMTITDTLRAVRSPISITNLDPATWASVTGTVDSLALTNTLKSRSIGLPDPVLGLHSDFRFDNWIRCTDLVSLIPSILSTFNFDLRLR